MGRHVVALCLLLPLLGLAQAPKSKGGEADSLLWGSLASGPHAIGFRSSIALDESRHYGGRKARPILLDVWYPAAGDPAGPRLPYAEYLRVPEVALHPWFQGRLEAFIRKAATDDLFHKKPKALSAEERAQWERLLATRTAARADATPLPGPFPLVLYHSGAGGSVEDNSVLFEYLASHGYVVISSAFQSPYTQFIGNNIGDLEERSGPDLDFMARQARQWPWADSVKLAAIGHSAGAQLMLQWIGSPECPARAFVSLDTTLEYTPEDFKGHKSVRKALRTLTPPRIPVLLFAQARRKPRFGTFDAYLRHSPHYEAEVTELSHDDFLTHGFLGRALRSTPEAEAVRRSYEEVCRTILAFLDESLKGDVAGAEALRNARPSSPVAIRYVPAS